MVLSLCWWITFYHFHQGTDGNKEEAAVKVMTDIFGGRILNDFVRVHLFREVYPNSSPTFFSLVTLCFSETLVRGWKMAQISLLARRWVKVRQVLWIQILELLPMSLVASLCIADRSKAMQDSRIGMLATKLIELIDAADYPTLLFTHETRMRHELEELRSKSLGVEASPHEPRLIQHIHRLRK